MQIQCDYAKFEIEEETPKAEFIAAELADVPSYVKDNEETFSADEMEEDEETDESLLHPKT